MFPMSWSRNLFASFLFMVAWVAAAQAVAQSQNVLTLSAHESISVQQDMLSITLTATRDGDDASQVQTQIKQALDDALSTARAKAGGDSAALDVRGGNFSLEPRIDHDNHIAGWHGQAELILEGRDFARLSQVAGQLDGLTVSSVRFGLSREQRQQTERQAQTRAIDMFKQRATALAKNFGFNGYSLRDVTVDSGDGDAPVPASSISAHSHSQTSSASDPVPVQPGKVDVCVTVRGTIQLK